MSGISDPFPSEAWFTELVRRATSDRAALDHLGIADLRLGIEIVADDGTAELYGLVLDGYAISAAGLTTRDRFDPEVVVSGPLAAWREMVSVIEGRGAADGPHTLNSLSLAGVPLEVRSDDAVGQDKFYRYMGTLQAVFDAAGAPARAGNAAAV